MKAATLDLPSTIPRHIGIILDGNRRWAKEQGIPTLEGHRRGYDNLKDVAKYAFSKGVTHLTAFIFSTENWNRSKTEVSYLMKLSKKLIDNDGAELSKDGYRVVMLGSREGLSKDLLASIDRLETQTVDKSRGTLGLCFNYGGQQEIVDAVKAIINENIEAKDVTKEVITEHLYASGEVPALDLLVRTSGEQRLSNFMLWRAAYAEIYFEDKFWPAFTNADLDKILNVFALRQRRFGK